VGIGSMGGTALKRSYPKPPPALAGTGEKKPTESGWFLEFWWWSIAEVATDYLQICREFYTNERFIRPCRDICPSR
jgi:hypothetical protein